MLLRLIINGSKKKMKLNETSKINLGLNGDYDNIT